MATDRIPVKQIIKALISGLIFLISLHILLWFIAEANLENAVIVDIFGRFSLDQELSVPTWYSTILLAGLALLSYLAAITQTKASGKRAWLVVAGVTAFMSLDEATSLHELTLQGLHIIADFSERQTFFANAWLLLLPGILVASYFIYKVVHHGIEIGTQKRLLLAAVMYLSGAFVVEYLSIPVDKSSAFYILGLVVLEEGLEIIGIIIAISAVLLHINTNEVRLRQDLLALFRAEPGSEE